MLDYEIWVDKNSSFYTLFHTKSISGTNDVGKPVSSEIEGGAAFSAIRAHRQIKLLLEPYPHAVHQLFLLHQEPDDLYLRITFQSYKEETHVEYEQVGIFPVAHLVETSSTREIAQLYLTECNFQRIVAVGNESYEVSFKVGAVGMKVDKED
jgi:hypothetical protein